MKSRVHAIIFRCIFFFLLNGLVRADGVSSSATDVRELGTVVGSGIQLWHGIEDDQQRLWTVFYPGRHDLSVTNPDGVTAPLVMPPGSAPSGLALAPADAGRIWIAYRSKAPVRALFATRSDELAQHYPVSGDSLPLARLLLEPDGNGGIYALWYDEQAQSATPGQSYWLFFNQLNKDGQASTPERVLPGIYPLWLRDARGRIAVVSWYYDEKGSKVSVRVRSVVGEFGPELEVARTPPLSLPMGTFISAGRWFVYWVAQYGELKDDFLIEGAYSDDLGVNWTHFGLDGLRRLDVRSIATATDDAGHIALAITGRYRGSDKAHHSKHSAYLVTSSDNGTTWNAPQAPRPASVLYSQAPNAKVAFIGPNKDHLLFLIEDWRAIRPALRYWLSADHGTSWAIQDGVLPLDPGFNYELSYTDPTIYPERDGIQLLLQRSGDDLARHTIVAYRTSLATLLTPSGQQQPPPDPQRLKARVAAYGKALVERDYQAAYELFDPFYRARTDFFDHMKSQGRILYTTAEYVDADIQGNIADVKFHIVASVPRFKGSFGQDIESPVRNVVFPARWLWISGEWYLEYYSEGRDLRYTKY